MTSKRPLTAGRPSRAASADTDNAATRRAINSVKDTSAGSQDIRAKVPNAYHQKLGVMASICEGSPSYKELIQEALDDLFDKYASGEGARPIVGGIDISGIFEGIDRQ